MVDGVYQDIVDVPIEADRGEVFGGNHGQHRSRRLPGSEFAAALPRYPYIRTAIDQDGFRPVAVGSRGEGQRTTDDRMPEGTDPRQ